MRQLSISLVTVLGLCLAPAAFGEEEDERKIWACSTFNDNARPLIHLVENGPKSYVKFANRRIGAAHKQDGAAQEWLWGNKGGFYDYSVALGPDNIAAYYDFSSVAGGQTVPEVDKFRCRQVQ